MGRCAQQLGLLVAVCGSVVAARAEDSLGRIRVGAAFPEVSLPHLSEGKPASIGDFRGRPTVLIVFASW